LSSFTIPQLVGKLSLQLSVFEELFEFVVAGLNYSVECGQSLPLKLFEFIQELGVVHVVRIILNSEELLQLAQVVLIQSCAFIHCLAEVLNCNHCLAQLLIKLPIFG
jgi:hypothetical protein